MRFFSICFFISIFCVSAFAGQLSEIILVDGSTLYGEVVSLNNGIYKIKTQSLGIIEIKESKISLVQKTAESVKSLVPQRTESVKPVVPEGTESIKSLVPEGTNKASVTGNIVELQRQMMGNEDIMKMIMSLQSDPEVQKLMSDPDFINSVNSGDINAIMNDPRLQNLLKNPTVKEIHKKVVK